MFNVKTVVKCNSNFRSMWIHICCTLEKSKNDEGGTIIAEISLNLKHVAVIFLLKIVIPS